MRRLSRLLPVALFAASAVAVASFSPDPALGQDPKQKDKAKEPKQPPKQPKAARIAISEPTELKDDKDFALQGEYEGVLKTDDGEKKLGVQVVAKGQGKFDVKIHTGGLPGAGWDGKATATVKAAVSGLDGAAEVEDNKDWLGLVAGGKFEIKYQRKYAATLKKVDRKSPTLGAKPPAGADVLFGKSGDESNWNGGKLVKLSDGEFLNMGIKSKKSYGSFTAHIEFRLPWMPNSGGQQRGNSGFYLQDRYELQILDSFGLKGENNECGGIYTQYKPLVNMCLPPMVWQTYDIEFTAAQFDGDKKTKPAVLTVKHNGVTIHDKVELKGPTGGGQPEKATPGPIQLQNHGDPLVFRNVWIAETK